MDDAAQICSRLMTAGAVRRIELPELDHPAVREEVERRLGHCGFVLASSAYSDHYGIRLCLDADSSVLDKRPDLIASVRQTSGLMPARAHSSRSCGRNSRFRNGLPPTSRLPRNDKASFSIVGNEKKQKLSSRRFALRRSFRSSAASSVARYGCDLCWGS